MPSLNAVYGPIETLGRPVAVLLVVSTAGARVAADGGNQPAVVNVHETRFSVFVLAPAGETIPNRGLRPS
jgi:hypothetical protein